MNRNTRIPMLPFRALCCAGLGMLLLAGTGCSLLPKEEEPLKPPLIKPAKETLDTIEATEKTITKQLSATAALASLNTQSLYFTESGGHLASVDVQLGSRVRPGDIVARLDSGDLEVKVKQKQLAVEKAEIALEQAKDDKVGDGKALRLKAIDVESAKLELEELQRQLARTKLVSSIDGIVSYIDTLKEGETITAYRPFITLSDPNQVKIVYESTNPNDLAGVQLNMDVQVTYRSKTYGGKVVQTPATAPVSDDKTIMDRNSRTLIMTVEGLPAEATIGDQVDFVIVTEKREHVIVIPRAAVRTYNGRDYVQILDGESRKEVDVERGINNALEVEIRKGLKAGQRIILN